MNQPALTTSARTILRVIAGFLFAAHGWQKFNEFTIAGTQAAFTQMGVPAAQAVAPVVATLELVGGVALILGVLTRVFAVLLALDMLGALFMVHALENDDLVHEAPAIVSRQSPSALAHGSASASLERT